MYKNSNKRQQKTPSSGKLSNIFPIMSYKAAQRRATLMILIILIALKAYSTEPIGPTLAPGMRFIVKSIRLTHTMKQSNLLYVSFP